MFTFRVRMGFCNRCVIEVFGGVCVCCRLVFEFSVGIGGFVIGLGQISFFFSLSSSLCDKSALVRFREEGFKLRERDMGFIWFLALLPTRHGVPTRAMPKKCGSPAFRHQEYRDNMLRPQRI